MTNLKPLAFIFSIFVLATIGHCRVFQPDDAQLIAQTCKKTPNPDLCVQLLQANPCSSSADVKGLALILINVTKARTSATLSKINQLIKSSRDPGQKKALLSCAEEYELILKIDIPQATSLVVANPKFAVEAINDAGNEVTGCESEFPRGKSPITSDNKAVRDVTDITSAIISLFL